MLAPDRIQTLLDQRARWAFTTLLIAILTGLAGIFIYSFCPCCFRTWYCDLSIGILVACASSGFGGFFGFLFGMPRSTVTMNGGPITTDDKGKEKFQTVGSNTEPNTNLEQISDWLTKILVGAGLTQLNKIPGKLGALSNYLAEGMSNSDSDKAFIIAVIIFFAICGFFGVFLWTKLFMPGLLSMSVEKLAKIVSKQGEQLTETDQKQQQEIERARDLLKKLAQSAATGAMEDPLLAERQAPGGDTQVAIAAELVKSAGESDRSATDLIILAFHEFQAENYVAAAEYAEKALNASPQKEMLWKIYNLLGLCYHWQQPANWKPGGDLTWFNNATKYYQLAYENKTSLSEELLAKANLCYVYLDAQKYDECEKLAETVFQKENVGGVQITSICDLARIASAASKILQGDNDGASKLLNDTKNLSALGYLFNPDDLPAAVIKNFPTLPGLKADVQAFLKQMAGS